MTTPAENAVQTQERRAAVRGEIDFSMMYIAHDAFNRHMTRLLEALETDDGFTPEARGTWELFVRTLRAHHKAEDAALWPALRRAVSAPDDLAIIDAMEAEHAEIDPRIVAITAADRDHRVDDIREELAALQTGLSAHMRHEETEALPLLERTLGPNGWAAFPRQMRSSNRMRDMAMMIPWILDGASPEAQAKMLGTLPPPVRVMYHHLWAPRYARLAVRR